MPVRVISSSTYGDLTITVRERERERERKREREWEREREREWEWERDIERERESEREIMREKERERERCCNWCQHFLYCGSVSLHSVNCNSNVLEFKSRKRIMRKTSFNNMTESVQFMISASVGSWVKYRSITYPTSIFFAT